jgi:phospholipase D1/2
MIVDDQILILGSANLNDRSMLGSRDSELAVRITGPQDMQVMTDEGPWAVCTKVHQFRRSIFSEHFGMDIPFPTNSDCWSAMVQTVRFNTDFYSKSFKIFPSNEYRSFAAMQHRNKEFDQSFFDANKHQVRGNAVEYPYYFLNDEDIIASKNSELSLMVVPLYALM